jgi:hypothetical protein
VQRSAFDDPKTKPQPLATLQLSVPTRTPPCACAAADTPAAKPITPIAKPSCFSIPSAFSRDDWIDLAEVRRGE